jgi:hypothetical protein
LYCLQVAHRRSHGWRARQQRGVQGDGHCGATTTGCHFAPKARIRRVCESSAADYGAAIRKLSMNCKEKILLISLKRKFVQSVTFFMRPECVDISF